MRLNIPIRGIRGEIRKDLLLIRSEIPLRTFSSAVLNGGLREAKAIINRWVPKTYSHANPEGFLKRVAKDLDLPPEDVVGLMTSVDMRNAAVVTRRDRVTVTTIVTAGLSNPARAGDATTHFKRACTINIIILIDGNPTDGCLVDAAKTATESKSVALRELDIRSSFSKEPASGTTTDAIVVASTMRGRPIKYAGTATKLGRMISTSVIEAVKEAVRKQEGITPDRSLIRRLEERGITLKDLVNTALELFIPHPKGIKDREKASKLLEAGFRRASSDPNVAALVMAGLRLAEDGRHGLIPSLPAENFEKDPMYLVADEIMGMSIANYIAGSRGIFELVRFNKIKPGILRKLDPVSDDVIAGLIAGVSSNMYTRAANRR